MSEPIEIKSGCGYTGPDFGASYDDSVCLEGYLWDADSGESCEGGWAYAFGGDIPCPGCNHEEWLGNQQEDIEIMGWEAHENGDPISENRYLGDAVALRYPDDRPTLIEWWNNGWNSWNESDA